MEKAQLNSTSPDWLVYYILSSLPRLHELNEKQFQTEDEYLLDQPETITQGFT